MTARDIKTLFDSLKAAIVSALPMVLPDVAAIIWGYHIADICDQTICGLKSDNLMEALAFRWNRYWVIKQIDDTYHLAWHIVDWSDHPSRYSEPLDSICHKSYNMTSERLSEWIMSGNLGRILWKKYKHPAKATRAHYIHIINKIADDIVLGFYNVARELVHASQ